MLVNTPPMGWNSWNTFGRNISDELIRTTADQMVAQGLDKAGYRYVVIDDCWSERERDPRTGRLVPDRKKFPAGIKALADYIHDRGLAFGIYSCAGVRTCAGYPGSFDHEFLDAATFAEFGVDFLKYDFCYCPDSADGPLLYRRMGNALRACGRDILFSACNWGSDDVWSWIRSSGAHMYRSTGDIVDTPASFAGIAKSQIAKFCYSAPQCFNDIDMLTVGMYGKGNVGHSGEALNEEEKAVWFRRYQCQFALWCLLGSPLMLGCDIRSMEPDILELVSNRELIAINQDPECRTAFPVHLQSWVPEHDACVLAKLLADGTLAVGFFNFSDAPRNLCVLNEALGFPYASGYTLKYRNILTGHTSVAREEVMLRCGLPPYECCIFRVTPVKRDSASFR